MHTYRRPETHFPRPVLPPVTSTTLPARACVSIVSSLLAHMLYCQLSRPLESTCSTPRLATFYILAWAFPFPLHVLGEVRFGCCVSSRCIAWGRLECSGGPSEAAEKSVPRSSG